MLLGASFYLLLALPTLRIREGAALQLAANPNVSSSSSSSDDDAMQQHGARGNSRQPQEISHAAPLTYDVMREASRQVESVHTPTLLVQHCIEITFCIMAIICCWGCCCRSITSDIFMHELAAKVMHGEHAAASPEVKWLNDVIWMLWPRVEAYVQDLMQEVVAPLINRSLPTPFKGTLSFQSVSLGDTRPHVGPIQSRERGEDTIVVDATVNFDLKLDFSLSVLGAKVGVRRAAFSGVVTVVFRPIIERPPFFGGLEIYFANPPEIALDFTGVANAADTIGLKGTIRSSIQRVVNRFLVLPARIAVDIDQTGGEVDVVDLKFPSPMAILRLSLKSAQLIGDGSSPHPFVLIQLGQNVWNSSTAKRTSSPEWGEQDTTDFLIYDQEQVLSVQMYDEAFLGSSDLVGEARGVPLSTFTKGEDILLPLELRGAPCGTVTLAAQWLELEKGLGDDSPQILLEAKLLHVKGLSDHLKPPFHIVMSSNGERVESSRSRPRTGRDWAGPSYRQIVFKLAELGVKPKAISEAMDYTEEVVDAMVKYEGEADETKKEQTRRALFDGLQKRRAVAEPLWGEVISLSLERSQLELLSVTLKLLDQNDREIGSARVTFNEILASPGCEKNGPFVVSGPHAPAEKEPVQLYGSLRMHHLQRTVSMSPLPVTDRKSVV